MITREQEFDIACQVNEGSKCDRLEMLKLCFDEIQRLKNKVAASEQWTKTLERQLKRYTRGNAK